MILECIFVISWNFPRIFLMNIIIIIRNTFQLDLILWLLPFNLHRHNQQICMLNQIFIIYIITCSYTDLQLNYTRNFENSVQKFFQIELQRTKLAIPFEWILCVFTYIFCSYILGWFIFEKVFCYFPGSKFI